MDKRNLTDKEIQPTDEIIYSFIGDNKKYWKELMDILQDQYPDLVLEWKYYRDGGSWLLPVAKKKKNLCWISLKGDTFVVGFWFGTKVETLVEGSELSEKIKNDFRNAERNKMGRGLAITIYSESDLKEALELIGFKNQLK